LDVFVANGFVDANFVVQAVEGAPTSATITATAPGFASGTGTVTVVQAALDISSLPTTATSLSADDPFWIRVGLPNAARTALNVLQPPRVGAPLTVTITNSNAAVAQLVTTALTGQQVAVTLPAGQLNSATTVAQGGVALHAGSPGSTTVSATIPGFIATTDASVAVTIS